MRMRTAATVLLSFSILFLVVVGTITGDIRSLLHPRVVPRTVAAAVVLFAAVAASLRVGETPDRGHDHGHATNRPALWPLLVPLVLLPAALQGSSDDMGRLRLFTPGGSGSTGGSAQPWVAEANPDLIAAAEAAAAESTGSIVDRSSSDSAPPAAETLASLPDVITIDTDTFTERVNLLWDAPRAAAGRRVEITGFTYRRPQWPREQFVVARLSIWCCVADAAVVGLLSRAASAAHAPEDGSWITLSGTVYHRASFSAGGTAMDNVPELRDLTWQGVEKPQFEYVFPE